MTLKSTLESIGYTYEKRTSGKNAVFNDKGEHVGDMRACECWAYLKANGLVKAKEQKDE